MASVEASIQLPNTIFIIGRREYTCICNAKYTLQKSYIAAYNTPTSEGFLETHTEDFLQ